MTTMLCRTCLGIVLFVALLPVQRSLAEDQPNTEQLRKLYDDALKSLENAQNRKNELSGENDKLKAKVEELNKQLADTKMQLDKLKQEQVGWAGRTFFYRSNYAAWKQF